MNALEFAEAQKWYLAMDSKKRMALVRELAVRHALPRVYVAEYAEANDDDSVRIVWIDGLHRAQDLEFDASFRRFFRSEKAAWKAAAASLRHNIRAQTPDDLREGITCYGFAICAKKGVTLRSFAAQLRHVHTITDEDEKDGAMLETLRNISIFGLTDDVCLREFPYYPDCKKEVMTLMEQVIHGRRITQQPTEFHRRYWCF